MPYTYEIIADEDPMNPRKEWDNLGTMVCWHSRYDLGDEQAKEGSLDELLLGLAGEIDPDIEDKLWRHDEQWEKHAPPYPYSFEDDDAHERFDAYWERGNTERKEKIAKVLDNGYIMLPLSLYDHGGITMSVGSGRGWDRGQVGYIYLSVADAKKEYGWKNMSKKRREKIVEYLSGEVEVYDQYLTGDIWGYRILDNEGNDVDSCWGFFGHAYCEEEAKSVMTWYVAKEEEERIELIGDTAYHGMVSVI